VGIVGEPLLAVFFEVVARPVIDDEKDFPRSILRDEVFEENQERLPVENVRELIRESGFEAYCAENVRRLSCSEGVNTRLIPNPGPSRMKGPVEPEAYFVAEDDDSSTLGGFFLIAGNLFFSQTACFSLSARANRLRGRCTEKPSL
jgi:hypothetical protein